VIYINNKQTDQQLIQKVNTKANRQLLYKYLVKHYSKTMPLNKATTKAKAIVKKHQDNLFGKGGVAYNLGSKSLEFFCRYYLQDLYYNGDDKYPLSPTHYQIWQELENMILKKDYPNRNYIMPRGFGKTTCISTPIAIWTALYKYKKYIVIASAILDTSTQFLKTIKSSIQENPYIKLSFGQLINTKGYTVNEEKLELTNGTMIQSISASGAIRGKNYKSTRIELLILDDYQKADEVATDKARDKKWKTFNADAKNAMQKNNATMLAVGTYQHKEDFYSRLTNSPTWKTRHEKGVLIDNLDKYFNSGHWEEFYKLLTNTKDDNPLDTAKEYYFQHKKEMQYPLLWHEYWDCLDYALNYYEDRQLFLQEVQNDVTNLGEKRFKTIVTESPEEIETHTFTNTLLSIDPAGTSNKGNKKDYYAYCVGSKADNKIKYIRKGEIYKHEFDDYMQHTLDLLKQYPDITHLAIEKNVYSGADVIKLKELLAKDNELKHRNLTIINEHRNKNKDERINTIVGDVNMGRVVFNADDEEALQQLADFCGAKYSVHDDFPDVLADCVTRLDTIKNTGTIKITQNYFS